MTTATERLRRWPGACCRNGAFAPVFMSPPKGMTVGEGWLWALADFVKIFLALVVPLLALAAALEVHVTPLVVLRVLGG